MCVKSYEIFVRGEVYKRGNDVSAIRETECAISEGGGEFCGYGRSEGVE